MCISCALTRSRRTCMASCGDVDDNVNEDPMMMSTNIKTLLIQLENDIRSMSMSMCMCTCMNNQPEEAYAPNIDVRECI